MPRIGDMKQAETEAMRTDPIRVDEFGPGGLDPSEWTARLVDQDRAERAKALLEIVAPSGK
jgi:hypothetical protein